MKTADRQALEHILASFCADVLREPPAHFSEGDLQVSLYAELLPLFGQLHETAVCKRSGSDEKYRTRLIHREYGRGGGRRMDLLVFFPDDVRRMSSCNLQVRNDRRIDEYVVPRFGFELGTEKGPTCCPPLA